MRHVLIVTNRDKDQDLKLATQIKTFFENHDGSAVILPDIYQTGIDQKILPANLEAAIALGGDGTILQLSRGLRGLNLPIMGVNLGHLGFLAETEVGELDFMLDCLLRDQYRIEKRMMIAGQVVHEGNPICESMALNDIVIGRSGFSRIISMDLFVNGQLIDNFQADGMIIATPTGSTAYSLSAGGPIINPIAELIEITPICAHSMQSKSIILDKNDKISVQIKSTRRTQLEEAHAVFDGQKGILLSADDMVNVEKAEEQVKLIRIANQGFYHILKHKLDRF